MAKANDDVEAGAATLVNLDPVWRFSPHELSTLIGLARDAIEALEASKPKRKVNARVVAMIDADIEALEALVRKLLP